MERGALSQHLYGQRSAWGRVAHSSHHMASGYQTKVFKFSDKHLYHLRHLAGPGFALLRQDLLKASNYVNDLVSNSCFFCFNVLPHAGIAGVCRPFWFSRLDDRLLGILKDSQHHQSKGFVVAIFYLFVYCVCVCVCVCARMGTCVLLIIEFRNLHMLDKCAINELHPTFKILLF